MFSCSFNMFWMTATSQTSSEEEMKDIGTVKPTVMFGSRSGTKKGTLTLPCFHIFGFWRFLSKTTVCARICASFRQKTLQSAMVLGCLRFKVATKHRKPVFHVFSAPSFFKSGLNRNHRFFPTA